jgi:hypothetical protein
MLLPRQIENRHILWSALAMLALGLIVPGVFGVKPPQWFAVPQQQEPGQNLAAGSAPTKAQIPATTTPDAIRCRATAGITSARPDADQDAMSEQSSLSANPAIVMVPADFARRIPERHLALSGADQKQSFINLVLPLIVASNDELVQRRNAVKAAFDAKNRAMLEKWAVLYRVDPEKLDDAELAKQLLRRVRYHSGGTGIGASGHRIRLGDIKICPAGQCIIWPMGLDRISWYTTLGRQ